MIQTSWLSLLPPLIVITTVLFTQNLNMSLLIGIATASIIATYASPLSALKLSALRFSEVITDSDTLYLYAFLCILGAVITLISKTGGAYAFARYLQQKSASKKQVEWYTLLLSLLLSIDDYLSALTVGYVMRPITDQLAIPRAKLAYFVHSLASSLILLVPISSWVTIVTSTIDQAGITCPANATTKIIAEPFSIYLQTIPYIFYAIITLISVVLVIQSQLSFGAMHTHETIALTTEDLFGATKPHLPEEETPARHGTFYDLIIPLATLLGGVILGVAWTGDASLCGGSKTLWQAFTQNTHLNLVLLCASIASLSISALYAFYKNKLSLHTVRALFAGSYNLMASALILITLAATLGKLLQYDLHSGSYLATLVLGRLPLVLVPVLIFAVSLVLSGITGSAFGVIMLLLPITIPMLVALSTQNIPAYPTAVPLLFPTLGAILSGAICGNHISPISDTTIMVSTSTNTPPLVHARTQLPYALPAIIGTISAFIAAGLLQGHPYHTVLLLSLGSGITTCIILLYSFAYVYSKAKK